MKEQYFVVYIRLILKVWRPRKTRKTKIPWKISKFDKRVRFRKIPFLTLLNELRPCILTLKRQDNHGIHVPVVPDLARTVSVESYQSENVTKVFDGAKNGIFSQKFPNIFCVTS